MGYNFSLVIRSHPFVGIYFINKGTNFRSFEIVCAKKYLLKCFWAPNFHMEITSIFTEFIA